MQALTKSTFILGLQCQFALWIKTYQPEKLRTPTFSDTLGMEEGQKIGELAHQLYPDGIDLSKYKYKENIFQTKNALSQKKPLFEAGFATTTCFSRADILLPAGNNQWDIIEVKKGTKVKKVNLHDVAFQKHVYEQNGLTIRKCFLLHLNNTYVKNGPIDIQQLFVHEDITNDVLKTGIDIQKRIDHLFTILSSKEPPQPGLYTDHLFSDGNHDCFTEGCVTLPENNIFCLYRGGKTSKSLHAQGIRLIKDIPPATKLNDKQQIQYTCACTGKPHINAKEIKHFLKQLKYPLAYLDFETFNPAVPLFDGTKPYTQIPFQFSLHTQHAPNADPIHYAFLHEGANDPREAFITTLHKTLPSKGSIVVYNQGFELGRLEELGDRFPQYKEWVVNIQSRVIDLLTPFREFHYHHPKQDGSNSIKSVLPAVVGKDYTGMAIADGATASAAFYKLTYMECSEAEKRQTRENLLKYCELDTMAEIMLVDKLKALIPNDFQHF